MMQEQEKSGPWVCSDQYELRGDASFTMKILNVLEFPSKRSQGFQ
jgi:hypothetical protein